MPKSLEFVDPDSGCECFAIVKRSDQSVGLAFSVIGQADFEIFLPASVATKLAELISLAATPRTDAT